MKKKCEFCNGTGQVSFFKGVSRFLLSEEECPECGGLGVLFPADRHKGKEAAQAQSNRSPNKKKK